MPEFETEIKEVIKRTYNVKSFRFRIKEKIDFLAGQFFFVTIRIEGNEATKHFSFSNSPAEKGYIEFTKKITGSEYSIALDKLKTGDWARLRLPYGQFTFQGEHPKIAFLSGGIGITPIRSICKFINDKKLPVKVTLLYSNNSPEDIIFKEDFEEMEKVNKDLKVIYTITLPDESGQWKGKTGRIDAKMIKDEIADYTERFFYLCGPPGMVESMKEILSRDLNIGSDRIKTENFTGYK